MELFNLNEFRVNLKNNINEFPFKSWNVLSFQDLLGRSENFFSHQAGFVSFSGRFCFKEAWVKRTDADSLETCSQQQHYKPLFMLDTAGKCLEKMHKLCL